MTKCSDNKTSVFPWSQKLCLNERVNGALLMKVFPISILRVCSTWLGIKNAQSIISMSQNYNLSRAKSTHFAPWLINRWVF